jgi:hypothetical protein
LLPLSGQREDHIGNYMRMTGVSTDFYPRLQGSFISKESFVNDGR